MNKYKKKNLGKDKTQKNIFSVLLLQKNKIILKILIKTIIKIIPKKIK